ncbi:hypothetical protein Q0F99_18045 [Rathayibacter oskolensis]|uniref:hypothetical protein n=1 Tax=Rathayibacter oskolensis TaxID=1891671 RepID=UPI00265FB72A|nr:hypothetical protein [Rathayibacter oskolensis]WKK71322.1 hypothetical protein Q0F99_18045 [Rathayibacter oskolensis]
MATVLVTGAGQAVAAAVLLVATALLVVAVPGLAIPGGWTLVALATVLGLFGPLFAAPQWLVDVSPIAVAPTLAGDSVEARGLVWLVVAVAAGATSEWCLLLRRRN